MPGGKYRWEFTGRNPPLLVLLSLLLLINTFAVFIIAFSLPYLGTDRVDPAHLVPIQLKGGQVYFLSPLVGWYAKNCIWIQFGLLGLIFGLMFTVYRKQIRMAN